ncbi:MAG TPA: hypothetical protein VKE22_24770 [Haliangiales bacterium]|nr:hypothetical protein [Haliangiales bacterium]
MIACVAERTEAAEACLEGWLDGGVPLTHIGLILSESTQERIESTTRCGTFAGHAVRVPTMGVMAAGAIVEDLAGNRGSLVDALVGLGLPRAQAETIRDVIQRGGMALVAFTEESIEFPPAVGASAPARVEEPDDEAMELERVQFLNLEGVMDAGDPTARRFCLLEVD